ncbi:PHA accumulation regulator DNA-binding protein [Oscillatoria nigro-viridis PCC 7112]|uniref:PHA accumulation regulator DNA-binding protein n=1 Tax=Phormidium nigroviride PCC 7112 TaxID=179408 RepID=K9VCY0_9CYAN|nr:type IV pilin-like G/H family protein [Oscillatoria nigro-viridis]AFZ05327.1 PHA accumulation regulator DNA-binding protein [Oscillatoria nigro-viridis PCC 7112]
MKTEFKTKFLQHLHQRKQDKGFTLIELLVVIIIIGILSAIALPSFLNQANKAKQSEAKQYIGSLNKGQQAFFTEEGKFTSDMSTLGVGIKTDTTNYSYSCTGTDSSALCMGKSKNTNTLNTYAGSVFLEGNPKTSRSILCETTAPSQAGLIAQDASDCAPMKAVGG